MDWLALPLETQVAQLFMVGYAGTTPNVIIERFLRLGVGGLIFFRDNFDGLTPPAPESVRVLLQNLDAQVPVGLPRPLFGIDQEGGQVERLPHTLFPTALTPRAVALSGQPEALAKNMYAQLARDLRQLGFHLDFFPTLDVNYQRRNPIIGVRSFADDPDTVWRLARVALQAFEEAGLIAVGKHFPGHGNGTVDSHLDLPTLHFTEAELQPFQQAIDAGLPAMLVAHGFYPALQTTPEEQALPASASPAVIQDLLRGRCGFQGVVITDDLCMGAITRHHSPVEAALAALRAGVDVLLYKQSTEAEWAVYEAVLQAFQTGALPKDLLRASLIRLQALKARYGQKAPAGPWWNPETGEQQADAFAQAGIAVLAGDVACLPLDPSQAGLLIHPDRGGMGNYAFDQPTSPDLDALWRAQGFSGWQSLTYPPRTTFDADALLSSVQAPPATIVLVTFNPLVYESQAALYALLQGRFPQARLVIASAGTPYDRDVMPHPALHLGLCSYRPATMRALVTTLSQGLASPAMCGATPAAEPR